MTVFQNSLGVWVLHDGSSYRYFQSEQEARIAMAAMNVSEQLLEIELAQTISAPIGGCILTHLIRYPTTTGMWRYCTLDLRQPQQACRAPWYRLRLVPI